MQFDSFGFRDTVQAGIAAAGYEKPTPIQEQAIPIVMQGYDVMGLAQTGTGKTAAFVLPMLHRLQGPQGRTPRALIVAPTRELAEQIQDSIRQLGEKTGLRSGTIYGGVGMNPQVDKLKRGLDIIVACPGRLIDHLQQRTVDLRGIETLVLDEADQMLDMGFAPAIEKILRHVPQERQTLLFSATMPTTIKSLAAKVLRNPKTVQIGHSAPAHTISHAAYPVESHLKTNLLLTLLKSAASDSVLVFMRTKHKAKRLAQKLSTEGYAATALQGNLSQNQRQNAIEGFRSGKFKIMVATDIAARGIDISRVSHVINFDIPETAETYTHRIGRTGRAERSGEAITFVSREDAATLRDIERRLGKPLPQKLVDGFDYKAPKTISDEAPRGPRGPRRQPPRNQSSRRSAPPQRQGRKA
jgi:ATP-dependent RNA helicase RhlE